MTLTALLSHKIDLQYLKPALEALDPDLQVVAWPDPRFIQAEVAVCWHAPPGIYEQMPRLKLVHSVASGVDNVIAGQRLDGVAVCRVVDPDLADGMLQFVLWGVLLFHRRLDAALRNQRERVWQRPPRTPASACSVGIMGVGQMGARVARFLVELGYAVRGWSRSSTSLPGVRSFAGKAELASFLSGTDILICLLPLTQETRGILSRHAFASLPHGAALIHCGRGEHLVESDVIDAVRSGQLRGALLDVFAQEPLPPEHPFWSMPGVVVTPHMATIGATDVVASQIARNIRQLRLGLPLYNAVDLSRGY